MTSTGGARQTDLRRQVDDAINTAIDKKVTPEFRRVNQDLNELKASQTKIVGKLDDIIAALNRNFNENKL